MKMNKTIRAASMLLAMAMLLTSLFALTACSGPNLSGLSGEELRGYTAMSTEHFEVTGGMFAYYFFEFGTFFVSDITEEELTERGFDPEKLLRDQKYDEKQTWYEYIRDCVISEVENTLLWCEAATAAGVGLTKDDYDLINTNLSNMRLEAVLQSGNDFESYLQDRYAGYIKEEDITKVMLMEALVAKYGAHLTGLIQERMTQERLDEYVAMESGERDETMTRNLGHIFASYAQMNSDQAYEMIKTAKSRFEEQGKTASAWETLWKTYSMDANMVYENVLPGEMQTLLNDWLFADGRQVGDLGIVTSDSGCHLLYYMSEGDPAYLANAKQKLRGAIREEILAEERAKIKIKKKMNVMNAIEI